MSISILDCIMAAILDLAQNEDLPWVDSGGLFSVFAHQ